jgi:hypothetical protein
MLRQLKILTLLLAIVFTVALVPLASAQQNPKRLVLKDGSYQVVTKWEAKGDRVRYYSADRFDWEELPSDLVDWIATDRYNRTHEKQQSVSAARVIHEDEADRKADEAAAPTVAPGLQLPDAGGVFVLDAFHGQPQLVELVQNGGELNKQTGKNILRAALNPLALSSKQSIELKGLHARVQAHETQPAFFINVDAGGDTADKPAGDTAAKTDTDQQPDRYRIVKVEQKKENRVIGNLSVAIYGKVSEKENWIKTTSAPVGNWVKVTPSEPLAPGEYALVEMLDKKQMNLYVWDFGVNPTAPANPSVWTPRQPTKTQTGTNDSPVLEKRAPKQ